MERGERKARSVCFWAWLVPCLSGTDATPGRPEGEFRHPNKGNSGEFHDRPHHRPRYRPLLSMGHGYHNLKILIALFDRQRETETSPLHSLNAQNCRDRAGLKWEPGIQSRSPSLVAGMSYFPVNRIPESGVGLVIELQYFDVGLWCLTW